MYAAGDVVSISGGDNGGGKSLDTQEIAGIYTVASVATDAVTLCGPCEAGVTYTNVVYRLRSYSLKLPPLVHLFGAGIDVTNLILATNANCDMIQLSPPAKTSCMNHIRDMGLQGQLVSQNGAVGVSCGIVYGYNVMDFYLDHVFVDNFKGHGIVVNNGWGGVLTDMLIERCSQNGLFLCGGDSAAGSNGNMKVLNNKIMSNLMHQVVLQYFRRTHISFCEMDGNSGYASIKSAGSSLNRITSNLLYAHATGSAIFITGSILGPGTDATITGNIFEGTGPAILCTLGEAAVASTSGVVVDGNDFGTASVDITATQGNIVFGRNGNYKNVVSGELKFLFHGVWDGAHAYIANDVVSSGAKLYRCKANTTNNEPPNATYWTQLGTSDDPAIIVLNHTMAVTPQWSWRTWMITPTSAQMALEHPFITDGTTTVTITFTGALTGVVGTPIPYWFLIEGTIASPRVNTVSAP
ncbi:MAG: right-handed parallel beta-helix repeat-containing protein, partial [Planctomycetes bacterium]|nr:right-handed parallel beta-helix repeat-containing protein [Planctomycetota bacterium]